MKKLLILLCLALSACDGEPTTTDQCMRVELFKSCMASLPAGPVATKYNDWDEVVAQCGNEAFYMAQRSISFVKKECR